MINMSLLFLLDYKITYLKSFRKAENGIICKILRIGKNCLRSSTEKSQRKKWANLTKNEHFLCVKFKKSLKYKAKYNRGK